MILKSIRNVTQILKLKKQLKILDAVNYLKHFL